MIVVFGAAGKFGRAALAGLVARGADVVGLAHNDAAEASILATGARAVRGNLRDEASLARALAGAHAVYHICPNITADEVAIGHSVIGLARDAGIKHFVLQGVSYPYVSEVAFHWAKAELEAALAASGLTFSIVRPVQLMQNIEWSLDLILARGRFELPYAPERRISLVDVGDVGAAVARLLVEPGWAGATWEMCGTPRAISRHEMVAVLSEAFATGIIAGRTELAELEGQAFFARLAVEQREQLTRMYGHLDDHGTPYFNNDALRLLLGREPTGYREFATRLAARRAAEDAGATQ